MLLAITDIPQHDMNLFDCITMQNEIYIPAKEVPIIDYLVTVYPRNENNNPFPFVYSLFEATDVAFAGNQDAILNLANIMFADSQPLSSFEQNILNRTFKKSIKENPILSGRK